MSKREDLREEIRTLEAERERLHLEEQILDATYWICPDGPKAKEIDDQLDENLRRFDVIGDVLGRLKARLYLLDAAVSRREHIADSAYGRML